ncbi:MAG: decaprenyl-phosphate phosphoribosyltransferase [Candidatus Dormibacteraeota bacterium]|nr:decaprenyl-phosphate phosphoribosyltransferase [Candidatus Dormibacteraeota bacterium]
MTVETSGLSTSVPARFGVGPVVRLLRPTQWVKNLLVLAAPLFAARLFETPVLVRTVAALVAFCVASSAAYALNDVRDREGDRQHPTKSRRPVASGALSPPFATAIAAALALLAIILGSLAGIAVGACVLAYLALMLAYSFWGRGQGLADVFLIASGFLLRAVAGAAAGPVVASPWFLALTLLLALMLGFGKRRAEISLLGASDAPARASLGLYTVPMLDQMLSALAASIIVLYAIYAVSIGSRLGSGDMILTWPLVLFGVIRYLQVSHTTSRPPDELLVADRPLLATVLAYAVVAAVVLRFHTHLITRVSL